MACSHDPTQEGGALGQYHCPVCGEMVLAGVQHPDYEAAERHLDQLSRLHVGDLVVTDEGYHAILIGYPSPATGTYRVAVGNGLEIDLEWHKIHAVVTLPNSLAHANFREWIGGKR